MMKGLKRLAAGGILLREVRGLRKEVADTKQVLERIAIALEVANVAQGYRLPAPTDPEEPLVEVTYASDQLTQEYALIEADLTKATGRMPNEDQVFQEWERRHMGDPTAPLPNYLPSPAERH